MTSKIIIFTLNGCFYCDSLMKELINLSIPFINIEITKNKNLWKKVIKETENELLPTIFIKQDNEGNGIIYVPEKDFKDQNEIIEIIKKII